MPYEVSVSKDTFNVSVYSRAGASPNLSYDLYYSEDNINFTLIASSLNSTTCALRGTVAIGSGIIYLKALDSNATQVYIRGSNSTSCPANLDITCTYNRTVTAASDVAITVYVDGSNNYRTCI